ncbi:hypothetical protein AMJ49_04960 [Parcubacteria bacterium DG_74_2]|nr:MAG: hypothetical protein AMJ49_04960 [Parcubacteria bacterium DG_74_2]
MKFKNSKKYQHLKIIGVILFFYILFKIDIQEFFSIFKNINLFYFFIAIILLPLSPLLGILKWKILINSQNIKISFRSLTGPFLKGLFLGTITPGKFGEFWRAKYLADIINISKGKAFYTAFTDRLIDVIVITIVSMAGIINLFLFNKIKTEWLIVFLFSILVIFIIYFLIKKEKNRKFLKFLINFFIPSPIKNKINSFFNEFFNGFRQLNFVLFLRLMGFGFFYYLSAVLAFYFLALSLGATISFFHLFLIVAIVRLLIIIPISVLGLGVREASYIFFFAIFNITAPVAVAFSVMVLFAGIILSIPGLLLFLKKQKSSQL